MADAVFSNFSLVRPTRTTLAPLAAKSLAISEHRVPPAPVTTATPPFPIFSVIVLFSGDVL